MAKRSISRYLFTHPGNIGIYGKTQSGKTSLIFDIIRNNTTMFRDKNDDPVLYNSIWIFHGVATQPLYQELQSDIDNVTFYRGFPREPIEEIITEEQRPALIFIDDEEELLQVSGENRLKNLVNRDCHHLDMMVIISFQSLYPRGNESVNIQRQFDVYILMTFSGNGNIKLKLEKILGDKKIANLIFKIWRKWTRKRGGYVLLDLHLDKSGDHENVLAWTKILPKDQDEQEDPPRLLMKKFL